MADNAPGAAPEPDPDKPDKPEFPALPPREPFPPPPEVTYKRPELPGRKHVAPISSGAPPMQNGGAAKTGAGLAAGVTFAASIIAGFLIGQWIDGKFNHSGFPWGMLVFTLLGAAAGFINLFRLLSVTDRNKGK